VANDNDIDAQVIANLRELQRRQAQRPDPPPLRIHHLMACAAVTAAQFSLWRVAFPQVFNELSAGNAAMMSVYLVFASIGLTCAIFSIYWHFKGYAGLMQPGQWLLLSYVFSVLTMYLQRALVLVVAPNWQNSLRAVDPSGTLTVIIPVLRIFFHYVVPAGFFVWCAWKGADTLAWRFVFVILAITHALPIAFSVDALRTQWGLSPETAFAVFYLSQGGGALMFEIWAVGSDLARRHKRFWTHWVGVVLSMIGAAALIVTGVMVWLR
jgi:hypothetical protein